MPNTPIVEAGPLLTFKTLLAAKLEFLIRLEGNASRMRKRFAISKSSFYRWRRGENVPWPTLGRIDEMYLMAFEKHKTRKVDAAAARERRRVTAAAKAHDRQEKMQREWEEECAAHDREFPREA